MSLVLLVSHITHLHSLHCCWSGIVFACADLKGTATEAAEWSQGGSLNLKIIKLPVNELIELESLLSPRKDSQPAY